MHACVHICVAALCCIQCGGGCTATDYAEPEVLFSDIPREMQRTFGSHFQSLQGESKYKSRRWLKVPADVLVTVVNSRSQASAGAAVLRTGLKASPGQVMAFDIEWEHNKAAALAGTPVSDRPTVVQYHAGSHVVIVHVAAFPDAVGLPAAFKELHADPSITWVGSRAKGDFKRCNDWFGAEIPGAVVCVGAMAKKRLTTASKKYGLEHLVDEVLKKKLLKDDDIRCSFTNSGSALTPDQVTYAALDVIAPMRVYRELQGVPTFSELAEQMPAPATATPAPVSAASGEDSRGMPPMLVDSDDEDTESETEYYSLGESDHYYSGSEDNGGTSDNSSDDGDTSPITPSASLKDIFHILQNAAIAFTTTNTLSPVFLHMLSETLLVPCPDQRRRVLEYLESTGMSPDQAKKSINKFLHKNPKYQKRVVPNAEVLYILLKDLESIFWDSVCPKKNVKLFRPKAKKWWKKLLQLVLDGHVSSKSDRHR